MIATFWSLVEVVWFWQLAVLRHSLEHPMTIVWSIVATAAITACILCLVHPRSRYAKASN
jgi:hypothetical protein